MCFPLRAKWMIATATISLAVQEETVWVVMLLLFRFPEDPISAIRFCHSNRKKTLLLGFAINLICAYKSNGRLFVGGNDAFT